MLYFFGRQHKTNTVKKSHEIKFPASSVHESFNAGKQTTRLPLVTSLNPAPDFDFNSEDCVTFTPGYQFTHQPFVLLYEPDVETSHVIFLQVDAINLDTWRLMYGRIFERHPSQSIVKSEGTVDTSGVKGCIFLFFFSFSHDKVYNITENTTSES